VIVLTYAPCEEADLDGTAFEGLAVTWERS
jgi:hypothetical protein